MRINEKQSEYIVKIIIVATILTFVFFTNVIIKKNVFNNELKRNLKEKQSYIHKISNNYSDTTQTNAIRMNKALLFHSKRLGIPLNISFGIAYYESGYRGVWDNKWKHNRISPSGALGAMQIMPQWANSYHSKDYFVTKRDLLEDIDLNVEIALNILSSHYKKYGDWGLALGHYNTGRPVINNYVLKILNF
jgi:soluble lytic murein transglycosylase-like protein